jgi:hypothetical protein
MSTSISAIGRKWCQRTKLEENSNIFKMDDVIKLKKIGCICIKDKKLTMININSPRIQRCWTKKNGQVLHEKEANIKVVNMIECIEVE